MGAQRLLKRTWEGYAFMERNSIQMGPESRAGLGMESQGTLKGDSTLGLKRRLRLGV